MIKISKLSHTVWPVGAARAPEQDSARQQAPDQTLTAAFSRKPRPSLSFAPPEEARVIISEKARALLAAEQDGNDVVDDRFEIVHQVFPSYNIKP